ncbi:MAG: HEAT repeat domain-containing protein [Planctomycetes bacterium]|nr:HEAT repeat domain-containing protein [Planctomycetota bacterium]
MTQSFMVECPHCHVRGELADPQLLGKAIACPNCQQTFAVMPPPGTTNPTATPAVDESAQLTSAPVTSAEPGVPALTVQPVSIPSTVRRSPFQQSPKPKLNPLLICGGVSVVVVLMVAVFLLIPSRRPTGKITRNDVGTKRSPQESTPPDDTSLADALAKMGGSDPSQTMHPAMAEATNPSPATRPSISETPGPAAINGAEQTTENIPPEIKAKLDYAYDETALPMLIGYLSHAHAGVRERSANYLKSQQPNSAAAEVLVKGLRDRAAPVRSACAVALEQHASASPDAIPALGLVMQKDPEFDVRFRCAATLAALARADAERARVIGDMVLPLLKNASPENIGYLANTCGALGTAGRPAIPILLTLVKQDSSNQDAIAGALAELGDVTAFGPFIAKKGLDNYSIKTAIAQGLGRQTAFTPAMLDVLKILYQDTDEQVRDSAIAALQTCQPKLPEAIPLLEQAQSDPHNWVRESAAKAIGTYQIDPEKRVRGLLRQMSQAKQTAWGERNSVSEVIRAMKADGLSAVTKIMIDQEARAEIREAAAETIGGYWDDESREPASIEQIKTFLRDTQQPLSLRGWCAVMLASGDPRDGQVDPTLAEVIAAPSLNLRLRTQAVRCITYANPPEKVLLKVAQQCEEPLPDAATDEQKQAHAEFHASLLSALNRQESFHDSLPRFLAAVEKGSPEAKTAALSKLQYLGKSVPESVQAARSVLKHESSSVRSSALETLGACHELAADTIPEIRAALHDENYSVRHSAARALGEFGPVARIAVPDLLPLVNGDEKHRNSDAASALARIAPGDPAVMTELIKGLEIPDNRVSSIEALRVIGHAGEAAVPTLRKIIPTSDPFQLYSILQLLGNLGEGAKPALPDIIKLLSSDSPDMRQNALQSLGQLKLHAAEAVPDIVQRLNDPNEQVQSEAIQTLAKIGPAAKAALPDLEKLAATDNDSLKYSLEHAIKRLSAAPLGPDAELFELLSDYSTTDQALDALPGSPLELIQSLLRLSNSSDDSVNYRAQTLLESRLQQPAVIQILETELDSQDPARQAFAAVLLKRRPAEIDPVEFARQLAPWYLYDKTAESAIHLAIQLGPEALSVLVDTMTGETLTPRRRYRLLQLVTFSTHRRGLTMSSLLRRAMESDSAPRRQMAALALAHLNPHEPEILPTILPGLESTDPMTRIMSITAVNRLANANVDASAAIPILMRIVANPADGKDEVIDGMSLTQSAGSALMSIGIGPDQIPEIRQMLQRATLLAEPDEKDEINNSVTSYAVLAVNLMSALGARSGELAPDFQALMVSLKGQQIYVNSTEATIPLLGKLTKDTSLPSPVRLAAVRMLGQVYQFPEATAPALAELLKDTDPAIAVEAAVTLVRNPQHAAAAVEVLRNTLQNRDKQTPLDVVYRITGIGKPGRPLLPELLKLANDPDVKADFRQTALRIAMELDIASPDVQAALLDYLRTAPQDRFYLQLPPKSEAVIPALIETVEKGEDPQRIRAIEFLGPFHDKAAAAIPALKTLMNADGGSAGTAAALALAQIDPTAKETLPRVIQVFNNKQTQAKAVEPLRRLGPNAAELLPVLITMLNDESTFNIPFEILEGMGAAARPALPLLVAALSKKHQYYAAHTLEELGENAADVAPQLIELMQSGRAGRATDQIPQILIRIGAAKPAVERLQAQLQDERTRARALEALTKFGEHAEPAVPQILEFAKGEPSDLRIDAFDALGSIGGHPAETVPVLAAALSDPDPYVAARAASGLTLRAKDAGTALPQILAALEKADSDSVWTLLHLLEQMKAKTAIPTLAKLAEAASPKLKRQIEGSMKRLEKGDITEKNDEDE